jgi:hypothetical protein
MENRMGLLDFNKILEMNSYACKKAFNRFLITGTGRYAYSDEWNMLADCIENIFNTIDEKYAWWGDVAMGMPNHPLVQKTFQQIRRLYMETFECRKMFAGYKRLAWGDIVKPEHTNTLIDVAKCLDDALERSPRRGRVYLLDTDDWGTASGLIEDGTIVFANFGTKAMSPVEVQYYLENYNVVFVIVIDKGNLGDTGAFYKVFYTEPYVTSNVYVERSFRLRRGAFYDNFGVHDCNGPYGRSQFWYFPYLPPDHLPADNDYMVSAMYKIPTAVRWTWQYGVTTEYRRIHLGGIDLPDNVCVTVTNVIPNAQIHIDLPDAPPDIREKALQAYSISGLEMLAKMCNASVALEQRFKEQLEIEFERQSGIGADILYSFAYARIGRGAVIEIPLSSLLTLDPLALGVVFDWYVGAMAHLFIGEPDKCYIGPMTQKLRKIVWMAKYGTRTYDVWQRADAVLSSWARRSFWRVIDLRTKKS